MSPGCCAGRKRRLRGGTVAVAAGGRISRAAAADDDGQRKCRDGCPNGRLHVYTSPPWAVRNDSRQVAGRRSTAAMRGADPMRFGRPPAVWAAECRRNRRSGQDELGGPEIPKSLSMPSTQRAPGRPAQTSSPPGSWSTHWIAKWGSLPGCPAQSSTVDRHAAVVGQPFQAVRCRDRVALRNPHRPEKADRLLDTPPNHRSI